jgi:hypothetical protein
MYGENVFARRAGEKPEPMARTQKGWNLMLRVSPYMAGIRTVPNED